MGSERLHEAFDRIEDFLAVNRGLDFDAYVDAVICLQEAVGIEDAERQVIRDRLGRLREVHGQRTLQPGGLLLGLILAGLVEEPS
jgi:hypothetical protein